MDTLHGNFQDFESRMDQQTDPTDMIPNPMIGANPYATLHWGWTQYFTCFECHSIEIDSLGVSFQRAKGLRACHREVSRVLAMFFAAAIKLRRDHLHTGRYCPLL